MIPTSISAAPPEQQAEVIRACWLAWNPKPDPVFAGNLYASWWPSHKRLESMLACGAYLSAVEMMVPGRQRIVTLTEIAENDWGAKLGHRGRPGGFPCGAGSTPALALLAAIAQVKEQDDA